MFVGREDFDSDETTDDADEEEEGRMDLPNSGSVDKNPLAEERVSNEVESIEGLSINVGNDFVVSSTLVSESKIVNSSVGADIADISR